jgi:hypothetical protein
MITERQALLLKRRHLLLTKLGTLNHAEIMWLNAIDMELGITHSLPQG